MFFQLILQITFLIFGICFKSDSNVLDTNFLSLLTKVQSTNTLQSLFGALQIILQFYMRFSGLIIGVLELLGVFGALALVLCWEQ